jgi:radical SAM protein with 4Fe4S-binding SPASM domain
MSFSKIADRMLPYTQEVVLTGIGEPTITKHFYEMCEIVINKYNKKLSMITNGIHFYKNERLLDLLINNNVQLTISIDGVKQTYEDIRCGAKWAVIQEVLKSLNVKRASKDLDSFIFGVNFVLTKQNKEELLEIINFCSSVWHSDYLCIILLHPFEGNEEFYTKSAPINFKEETNAILENAKELAKQLNLSIFIPAKFDLSKRFFNINIKNMIETLLRNRLLPIQLRNYVHGMLHKIFFKYPMFYKLLYIFIRLPRVSCPVFYERLYFSVNGDVASCCGLQKYIIGNILQQSIEDIFSGLHYKTLMTHVNDKILPYECHSCNLPFGITQGNPNIL